MKTLIAMRHANAGWGSPGMDDHDRPLDAKGLSDIPPMAQRLLAGGWVPQTILCSSATRTQTTAINLATELGCRDCIRISREAYLAPPEILLQLTQQLDEEADVGLIVAHNPGMHQFACELIGNQQEVNHFPPLSAAVISLQIDYWGEIDRASGSLIQHLYP